MNSTETSAAELSTANDRSAPVVRASPAMVMRCLLVSVDKEHTSILRKAAGDEGWVAEVCAAVDEALRQAFRLKFQLALVDVQSAAGSALQAEYEQLATDLARNHVPLLVVTGKADDPLAETRARELGVWLYLPGFDGRTELDVVFREARAVYEKTERPLQPIRGQPAIGPRWRGNTSNTTNVDGHG